METKPAHVFLSLLFAVCISRGLAETVGGPLFDKDEADDTSERFQIVIPSVVDTFKFDSKVSSVRLHAFNSGTMKLVVLRKDPFYKFNFTIVHTHEIKIKKKNKNKENTINGLNIHVKEGDVVGFWSKKKNFFKFRESSSCRKKTASWKTKDLKSFDVGQTLTFRRINEPKVQCREYAIMVNYNVPPCGPLPMDLYFVVDISKSINDRELGEAREALTFFLDNVEIGPAATQVGVIKYNSVTVNEISLGQFNSREEFVPDEMLVRKNVKDQEGGTRTDLAMEMVMKEFADNAKAGRGQVCILMTDGKSTAHRTEMEAMVEKLEATSFLTVAVGIGNNVDNDKGRAELRSIATGKGDENVHMVLDYEALKGITVDIMKGVCDTIIDYVPSPTTCNTMPTPEPTTPTPTLKPPVCVGETTDVFFVVDISKSINNKKELPQERLAVRKMFEYIDIGKDASRVGLIKYHREVETEFEMDTYKTHKQLEDHDLLTRGKIKGGTRTDLAMHLMMQKFKDDKKANRKQVCILLTDGKATASKKEMNNMTSTLENTDIKTIAVGIGGDADKNELRSIATGSGDECVFLANDFEDLQEIAGLIVSETCK